MNKRFLKKFNQVVDDWEASLAGYSMEDLLKRPSDDLWSMGQVYVHLINAALNFHLRQVQICMGSSDHNDEGKNFKGIMSFQVLGGIPPIRIKVPASPEYTPAQPAGKDEIAKGLAKVRDEMAKVLEELKTNHEQGKTKHPALGYLDADEWCKLVEMHFRHHLRQRVRLDKFLAQWENTGS